MVNGNTCTCSAMVQFVDVPSVFLPWKTSLSFKQLCNKDLMQLQDY
jgi:hypothetical protein